MQLFFAGIPPVGRFRSSVLRTPPRLAFVGSGRPFFLNSRRGQLGYELPTPSTAGSVFWGLGLAPVSPKGVAVRMCCFAGRGAAVGVAPLAFVSLDRLLGEALCRGRSPGGIAPEGLCSAPWGACCFLLRTREFFCVLFGSGGIAFQTNILSLNAAVVGLWPFVLAAAWFELLLLLCAVCWPPAGLLESFASVPWCRERACA